MKPAPCYPNVHLLNNFATDEHKKREKKQIRLAIWSTIKYIFLNYIIFLILICSVLH